LRRVSDYQKDGLVSSGCTPPSSPFEHVTSNIASPARGTRVKYPIAVDNDYATWNAYGNQYWPAESSSTQQSDPHVTFGEGDYDGTESVIGNYC